jgi:uncharacterized protein YkwD
LRKLAAALLAVPVVTVLYIPVLLRRSIIARVALAVGVGGLLALGAIGITRPAETMATPPTVDAPLTSAEFRTTLAVNQPVGAGVQIEFSTPMDAASVASAIRVDPWSRVELEWNADRTVLTIRPDELWRAGTYHTVTVAPGALAETGRPLTVPARAAFVTRPVTGATIKATGVSGDAIRPDSAFLVEFDRAVELATIGELLQTEPAVDGIVRAVPGSGGTQYTFTPRVPLPAATIYRLTLAPLIADQEGALVEAADPLAVRTASAPTVIRFRPGNGSTAIERGSNVSVRFSAAMDRASTEAAFRVLVDGKAIAGKVAFAEGDTVLVFDPAEPFGYGQKVTLAVGAGARSADGVAIETSASAAFTSYIKPTPRVQPPAASTPNPPPSAGSGSWTAVEAYYLRLMNCTRQGGLVTSTGACSSPGGRNVAALKLDSGISSRVARPYAKLLATRGLCSHFANGGPDDRLRRAGYTSYTWAENLGCRSGSATSAVLGSHLYFQSERSYNGGHYVNMMSTAYDRVGIGVWVYGGRVRLVVDFYRPR